MKYKNTTVSIFSDGAWVDIDAITELSPINTNEPRSSFYIGFDEDCTVDLLSLTREPTIINVKYVNGKCATINCFVHKILERHIHLIIAE